MSMNIKKGDKVVVLNTRRQKDKNGKPKTVTGKVLAVLPEKEQVIVEGYNISLLRTILSSYHPQPP